MAKYRPISPDSAWRSTRAARLEVEERYVELYLLSSPFTNVIGCYPIVETIASAEIGFHDSKRLIKTLERLQENGIIIYESGYVLVRSWFDHNTYESAFQGNVAKAAIREIASLPLALREKWIASCIEAGVPENTIKQLLLNPLISPLAGATKELAHNNNQHEQKQEHETPTTSDIGTKNNICSSGEFDCMKINLVPLAEQYRSFIESALSELPYEDAQMIADEASGTLEAASRNERKKIHGFQCWLPSLVKRYSEGTFVPQYGPVIAKQREVSIKHARQVIDSAIQRQEDNHKRESETAEAISLLTALNETELMELANLAAQSIPLQNLRTRVRDAVIKREIPKGLGKMEIINAVKEWIRSGRVDA